ncbi:hypothetical protein CW713_06810 [Methanophagales archaeon]|nr:MAG: hypothetical protein CW713_06810 [Methanophagales archaeon]
MKTRKILYEKWKAFAKKSSDVIAHVMLFLFFFLVFTPYTFIVRRYKKLLPIRSSKQESYWVMKDKKDKESYYKQY